MTQFESTYNRTRHTVRGYKFAYDGLSRMTDAVYGEGNALTQHPNRFNEQVSEYDKMGNILGLLRYGQTSTGNYGLVDNLNLVYDGNQLQSVYDSATLLTATTGMEFVDGVDLPIEYTYDENGNLTKDLNKEIINIQYSCLNLPTYVMFANGNSISYLYDANGTKLRTVHVIGNNTTTTDYCGNVIYENGIPKTLLTEAGYVSLNDNKYHYFIRDHQGNNRVIADEDGNVEEVNDYYPFGGLMASSFGSVQPYKYNGKELDRKNGLNLYDYSARYMEPSLGRFTTMDPLAEKYYGISPYAYCAGNPVKYVDPDGKWILNLISGIANAALDYGSQVAANIATGSKNALTDNINFGSIIVSGVEGIVNPIGATTKNIAKNTVKTVVKATLKGAGTAAGGQVLDNAIKGKNLSNDVTSATVVGGITGNIKISPDNSNANVTINKMEKKMNAGKTLTSGQEKQMKSAINEKSTNIITETVVNNSIETNANIGKKVLENEKNKD